MSAVEGWSEVDGALEREFRFDAYADGIAFVSRVGEAADAADHHPDMAVGYKRVTVRWTTHSAGGITDRDRQMAERTDELA
jgi:4a-hydroxytetrahydrobiopterin dehydratase